MLRRDVSVLNLLTHIAAMEFLESSALTATNVDSAFELLISSIYRDVRDGKYDASLEQFNYFGSAEVRQKALEQAQN